MFSNTPSIDATITFNNVVIHNGALFANYSYYDYQNRWDEIITPNVENKLLCEVDLEYSITGLLPLKIKVHSEGVLNFARTTCNYTSSIYSSDNPSMDFGSSCDPCVDNKRNVIINKDILDVSPLGHSYHITKESDFQCDIFMDPAFSDWLPGYLAGKLKEPWRTRF